MPSCNTRPSQLPLKGQTVSLGAGSWVVSSHCLASIPPEKRPHGLAEGPQHGKEHGCAGQRQAHARSKHSPETELKLNPANSYWALVVWKIPCLVSTKYLHKPNLCPPESVGTNNRRHAQGLFIFMLERAFVNTCCTILWAAPDRGCFSGKGEQTGDDFQEEAATGPEEQRASQSLICECRAFLETLQWAGSPGCNAVGHDFRKYW